MLTFSIKTFLWLLEEISVLPRTNQRLKRKMDQLCRRSKRRREGRKKEKEERKKGATEKRL